MRPLLLAALLIAPLTACAPDPLPDAAYVPPGAFGGFPDSASGAVGIASWILGEPTRSRFDPADAARAVAGVDYLAGELSRNPRWVALNPTIKLQMLAGRTEVRGALGIDPAAPSQLVVDRLIGASNALAVHDEPAALAILTNPAFTLGAQQTLARLRDLPALPQANVAVQRLNIALSIGGRGDCAECG